MVQLKESGYQILRMKSHLPASSPVYQSHRNQQRLLGLSKMNTLPLEKAYSFSVTFSSNPKTRNVIRKKILELVRSLEKEVTNSHEEEVYQLNIDFFDWT